MLSLREILLLVSLAAGQASATVIRPSACDARRDSCIKALNDCGGRNPEQVSTDCSKFVWKTVTPAQVTATKTSTKLLTATSTVSYTVTESITGGTVFQTITNLVTVIPSTIVNVTAPENTPAPVKRLARREPILDLLFGFGDCDPNIPSYARDCKDATRYASACSCYGVPAQISTVPARTTTRTETVTSTYTSLISSIGGTAYVTAPATTETATVTGTTTNTADTVTLSLFDLRVYNAPGKTENLYMRKGWGFQVSTIDDYLGFILEADGRVYTPDGRRSYFFCVEGDSPGRASITIGVYNDPNMPPAYPGQELYCGLDANQIISCRCTVAGTTYTDLIFNNYYEGIGNGAAYIATPGYPLAATQAAVTAQAVPFDWDNKCGYHENPTGSDPPDWYQECDPAYVDPKFAEDLSNTGGFEN